MKNVLRDWLGINEEKFALEVQLKKLQQKLDYLDASYADVDDTDNSEIVDTVFDLVMQEIENRDTIGIG